MVTTAALFDRFCRRTVPITGVSLGTLADRSTWRVRFAPTATAADRAAEPSLIATFDEAAEAVRDAPQRADMHLVGPLIASLVVVLAPMLSPAVTPLQLRAMIKAELRTRV